MQNESETSIAARFQAVAKARPDQPALVFSDMQYSYGMLLDLTRAFRHRMAEQGIGPGSTVQLQSRDLPVVLAAFLAASALGARYVETSITPDLAGPYPVTHLLAVEMPAATQPGERVVLIDPTWSPADLGPDRQDLAAGDGQTDPDAPWLLVATSGTTGTPKVVGLTQRMVLDRSRAVRDEFRPAETRFVSLFPYNSRPFFARAMGALLNGATIVDRGDWAFWIRSGVNRVSGSLLQAKSLAFGAGASERIDVLEVSGARLSDADARTLLGHFDMVDDTYGATETGKSFSTRLTLSADGSPCRNGAPRDSVVEIVGAGGVATRPPEIGTVRVRNGYMAREYLAGVLPNRPVAKDGWFYPGDTARFTLTGALDILGRGQSNVLNFDGVKLGAEIIEHLMQSVDGILRAAAFQSPKPGSTEVIAFAEFAPDCNTAQVGELARKACTDVLGAKLAPARVWPINTIPRKADGSIDREQCAVLIRDALNRTATADGAAT